jgi:hypothetical protein
MSPEQEEQAFEALLRVEAAKSGSLVQELLRGEIQAAQLMAMAGRHYRRAIRSMPGATAEDDLDEVYAHVYESIRSGAASLVHAYGYRVRGGDGSHLRVLELGAAGLAAWHPHAAHELRSIVSLVVRRRNQIMYDRPGVVTASSLRELLDAASRILPAFQAAVERRVRQPSLVAADAWRVPPLGEPPRVPGG